LKQDEQWLIEAISNISSDQATNDQATLLQSLPLNSLNPDTQTPYLSNAIAHFVIRNQTLLISGHASQDERFLYDPYIQQTQPKSVLCTPLIHQSQCIGLLYLENNLTTDVFTPGRVEILRLLVSQVAISIENSRLYEQLRSALTSERQARIALQASEARQAQFLDGVPIGILVVDAQGKPYYTNQTAAEILDKNSLATAHVQSFQDAYQAFQAETEQPYPPDRLPIVRALQGETVSIDDLEIHQDGEVIPLEISARPIFDPQGQIVYAIAAFQDITQRKKAEAERINLLQTERWLRQDNRLLQQLANYDGLTQISNRRRFDDLFALEWGRACREQTSLSVILCDVDFFKAFNDYYGHQAGDDCLKKIAIALEKSIHRETDLTARYGGEEFVLLLPNTHLAGAERVAERAKQNVAALRIEHARSQVKPQVSISLGYAALVPSSEDDPNTLLARADAALYLAKHQGRDRYYGLVPEDLSNP
jgi:diguanylate cyclase (GGDEF)-like protein